MINTMPKNLVFVLLAILFTSTSFADTTAPITSISKTPTNPNGSENWYTTPVQVLLNATDLESGIKEISYKLNDNDWARTYFYQTLNLAPNPSFESNGLSGWDVSVVDQYITAGPDTTTYAPSFNNTSVKLISSGIGWHGIHNINNFAVAEPYSSMTASAWLKTNGVSQTAYFKIYSASLDENNNIVKTYIGQSNTLTGTKDWTKVSSNFTVSNQNTVGIIIDIGLEGTGTVWVDAINISKSHAQPQTSFYVSNDGETTIQYYSVDQAGNIEGIKTLELKIDQNPPQNWNNPTIIHNIGDPDYVVAMQTSVEDPISGISDQTRDFQYKTETTYGIYANPLDCNSSWNEGSWSLLTNYPSSSGGNTATLRTPKISFCDNVWNKCKSVRLVAYDVAGNQSTKEYCINGPWIKTSNGGKVKSNYGINMTSEAPDYNSDSTIESGTNLIEFFSTSTEYKAKETTKLANNTYDKFWDKTQNKTEISNLGTNNGVYYVTGNMTIDTTPGNFNTQNFNQIIFVNGKLTINTDIEISNASTLLFIVKGNIEIGKNVQNIHSALFSDQNIYTAYDANPLETTVPLELKGSFSANKFYLQRSLPINTVPTEHFIYEPKYLINMKNYIKEPQIEWNN
jgi:hypothetical protein